jgi:AcrR family transcriptional regulator
MVARRGQAREGILEKAEELVKRKGSEPVTVEDVARSTGVAKGLIHYHFKTKQGLMKAVAYRIAAARARSWSAAFDAETPTAALERTWTLLTEESESGTIRAWNSLLSREDLLTDQTAKTMYSEFSHSLGDALVRMLRDRMDLALTVPANEIGWLLGAVLNGMGLQLLSGANRTELEGAYAAAWLGILNLTTGRG